MSNCHKIENSKQRLADNTGAAAKCHTRAHTPPSRHHIESLTGI
eukprot:SAG11_NODE_32946_length_280_cov_0.497238_1_plen_43_part_10